MFSRHQWTIVVLFLALGVFTANTFDSWVTLAVIAVFALAAAWIQRLLEQQYRTSDGSLRRSWWRSRPFAFFTGLLCLTTIFVAHAVPYLSMKSINPFGMGADLLSHTALAWIAYLWVMRRADGHGLMLVLGLIIVLLSVAAGGVSKSNAGQTTIAFCICLGYAIASQSILGRGAFWKASGLSQLGSATTLRRVSSSDGTETPVSGNPNRTGTVLSALTLSAMVIVTGAIAQTTNSTLPRVQSTIQSTLKSSLDSTFSNISVSGTRYVYGSTIGSIRHGKTASPDEVALCVFSTDSPGYLRGNAFDYYENRQWHVATPQVVEEFAYQTSLMNRTVTASGPGTTALKSSRASQLHRFDLTSQTSEVASTEPVRTIEVRNIPFKGTTVFMPLGSRWVEAHSGSLVVTHHGLIDHGVDVTSPYVIATATEPPEDELDLIRLQLLTHVPNRLNRILRPLAYEICGNEVDVRKKADKVVQFFLNNFDYSLNPTVPPNRADPLLYFFEKRHAAHCEYFASGTVALLRSQGIPARYVTGYVVDELEPNKKFWVARNRDAHAWAEAYDAKSRTWFPVESTPGHRYSTLTVDPTDDQSQSPSWSPQLDDETLTDSVVSSINAFIVAIRANNPVLAIFRVMQAPMFLVLSVMVWRRSRRIQLNFADPEDRRSHKMLRKMDRRMKRLSLTRAAHETMHQFADRIETLDLSSGKLKRESVAVTAEWYREFAQARYQGKTPSPVPKM
ncbi:transglutaminase family protein [Novipirellula sp.]|uniref:transglutaminase-like domain-containing protein n=1 Tax=Novipirellula sp. TaxID=2795430 RepID=UPI003567103F